MRDRSLGLTSAGRSSRHVPAGMQGYSGVLTPSTLSAPAQGALGALKTWVPAQFEERGMSRRGTEHNPSKPDVARSPGQGAASSAWCPRMAPADRVRSTAPVVPCGAHRLAQAARAFALATRWALQR
jgi:hypothetical protein